MKYQVLYIRLVITTFKHFPSNKTSAYKEKDRIVCLLFEHVGEEWPSIDTEWNALTLENPMTDASYNVFIV